MKKILSSDAPKLVGKEIVLAGWLRLRRDHGKLIFLDLRDGGGLIQLVVSPKVSEEAYKEAQKLSPEDVFEAKGTVKKRPEGTINKDLKTGEVEVGVTSLKLLSKAETLPFDLGSESLNLELPTLLDNRSLTLRHPKIASIFKTQETVVESFRNTAKKLGCTEIFVPNIAASATEGGAEVFKLDYYGHPAYLTQSPQLYKQMLVPVFERVFTISKAYRAEPSVTTRHLAENTQMDCEFGFVSFEELLDLLDETTRGIFKEFKDVNIPTKIPRITLSEAQERIFKETKRDVRKEQDLSSQDEADLAKWSLREHKSDVIIVHHFPTKKRAFYTMPDSNNPELSLSYDVIFRGLEIASGSQRINDHAELVNAIKERGMKPESFEMYLQAFKYGMPQEGGFSFGLERITMKLLGLSNIREASLYPRDMERVDERFSKQ